ncbi:MAG: amidohydrolase family protein [Planctomycetaceae bacterium]
MIIDSHQHFWHLDNAADGFDVDSFDYEWLTASQHAPICRNFLPADLQPHLNTTGVDKTVFVQTQHHLAENRWALELAAENDFIAGIVGWVDLADERCEDQLAEFLENPDFVGIRHVTQDEPDDDFIIRPGILRGLKTLQKHSVPFDLLFYTRHLRHAVHLASELPELPMVIDHLSKPRIREGLTREWQADICRAAAAPNIFCKLSGMITEADWQNWSVADLQPYVEIALEAFGPDRCMFGSDWPVCELAGSYRQVHAALREALGQLSDSEQADIFGGTAQRFYDLKIT